MYSDLSTQHAIDENIQYNQQDVHNQDANEKEVYGHPSKNNEEFKGEMLKEDKYEKKTEGQFSEAVYVEKGLRRSSGVSEFNDKDCGEPATGQHLRINFAFTEEDNIELENKCCSFLKFIERHPDLERIKVLPINDTQSSSAEDVVVLKKNVSDEVDKTAMQWMQHENMVKSAMRTKLKSTSCDADGVDYCDGRKTKSKDVVETRSDENKGQDDMLLSGNSRVPSADDLQSICQIMDEWDAAHPRCMDPPGPPVLNSTI